MTRVLDFKALLVYLNEEGIKLNDEITIKEKDLFNGIIKISHHDRLVTLSIKTAKILFGEVI